MLDDLIRRVGMSRSGRLLDLACGTGQLAFSLSRYFAEVWAVDQEPDMVAAVESKARASGVGLIRPICSPAERVTAPSDAFALITIGNAFHRLDRATVARKAFEWLRPGGHVALCWSSLPWQGDRPWQQALASVVDRWKARTASSDRIPYGWQASRTSSPDAEVLQAAGFEVLGKPDFPTEHRWTIAELTGLAYSTSFLPRSLLREQVGAFGADLKGTLAPFAAFGLDETIAFGYELARRPT